MQTVYEHIFDFKEKQVQVQLLVYMATKGYGYTKMTTQRMTTEYAISLNKKTAKIRILSI